MGYTVFYGGHKQAGQWDYDGWDCNGAIAHSDWNKRVQRYPARRRRRFHCLKNESSKIGWQGNGTGDQACSGLGSVQNVGGGILQDNYVGKNENFSGAFAGYKCTISDTNTAKPKQWSGESK